MIQRERKQTFEAPGDVDSPLVERIMISGGPQEHHCDTDVAQKEIIVMGILRLSVVRHLMWSVIKNGFARLFRRNDFSQIALELFCNNGIFVKIRGRYDERT